MKRRILVVDDEPEMREILKFVLREDYGVTTYGDGMEAIRQLRKGVVGLMIIDLRMPSLEWISVSTRGQGRKSFDPVHRDVFLF